MMKRCIELLVVFALLITGTAVLGADTGTHEILKVVLELADGSHIIGTPNIETLPVQTSYAKMNIPLKQIRAMKIGEDHETASLDLLNGDKLRGVISLGSIGLETVFGKVMIGVEHMKLVRVMLSGGPLPAGDGPLAFGGVNWTPWRTLFEVQGDKLVSLPKVRPGFNYGHGGNGRGPGIMTNIGGKTLDHGGIGFAGGHDCMIWIRNFSARRL